jgi:hypothetical protein
MLRFKSISYINQRYKILMGVKMQDNWNKIICLSTLLLVIIGAVFILIYHLMNKIKEPELILPILLVLSIIALIGCLCIATTLFHFQNMSDPTKSLGLPEGSVRAVIALSLIFIFMISTLFLYERVYEHGLVDIKVYTGITQKQLDDIPKEEIAYIRRLEKDGNETLFDVGRKMEKSKTSEDIAKQVITTVSTLVVAVAGFYFGTKAATVASGGTPATSMPVIRSINPTEGEREEDIEFKILGKNFELAKEVKLVRDSIEIQSTDITSSATVIKCKLKIPKDSKGYPEGKWTVVVINSDKGEDRLEEAFIVKDT